MLKDFSFIWPQYGFTIFELIGALGIFLALFVCSFLVVHVFLKDKILSLAVSQIGVYGFMTCVGLISFYTQMSSVSLLGVLAIVPLAILVFAFRSEERKNFLREFLAIEKLYAHIAIIFTLSVFTYLVGDSLVYSSDNISYISFSRLVVHTGDFFLTNLGSPYDAFGVDPTSSMLQALQGSLSQFTGVDVLTLNTAHNILSAGLIWLALYLLLKTLGFSSGLAFLGAPVCWFLFTEFFDFRRLSGNRIQGYLLGLFALVFFFRAIQINKSRIGAIVGTALLVAVISSVHLPRYQATLAVIGLILGWYLLRDILFRSDFSLGRRVRSLLFEMGLFGAVGVGFALLCNLPKLNIIQDIFRDSNLQLQKFSTFHSLYEYALKPQLWMLVVAGMGLILFLRGAKSYSTNHFRMTVMLGAVSVIILLQIIARKISVGFDRNFVEVFLFAGPLALGVFALFSMEWALYKSTSKLWLRLVSLAIVLVLVLPWLKHSAKTAVQWIEGYPKIATFDLTARYTQTMTYFKKVSPWASLGGHPDAINNLSAITNVLSPSFALRDPSFMQRLYRGVFPMLESLYAINSRSEIEARIWTQRLGIQYILDDRAEFSGVAFGQQGVAFAQSYWRQMGPKHFVVEKADHSLVRIPEGIRSGGTESIQSRLFRIRFPRKDYESGQAVLMIAARLGAAQIDFGSETMDFESGSFAYLPPPGIYSWGEPMNIPGMERVGRKAFVENMSRKNRYYFFESVYRMSSRKPLEKKMEISLFSGVETDLFVDQWNGETWTPLGVQRVSKSDQIQKFEIPTEIEIRHELANRFLVPSTTGN